MTLNHLRITFVLCAFSFFSATFSSCISNKGKQEESASQEESTKLLAKCWTHSYEDNTDERETYLPCDAKDFPPSRYRAQFTLAKDGSCSFSVLAANDAHTGSTGTWTYDAGTKALVLKGADGAVAKNYVIELLESDRILLK